MRINRHDTNGTKPLLGKGELGYDDYVAGGDVGRVYVGTGSENIALAERLESNMMTKAQFNALAEERKANRAGSGFDELGKHYSNTSTNPNVNEGIWTVPSTSNTFCIGRDIDSIGISKTRYPIGIVNGTVLKIEKVNVTNTAQNNILLPTAPNIYPHDTVLTAEQIASGVIKHADASNSGLIVNGKFDTDTSGWTANNATLSVENNKLKIVDGGAYSAAKQSFTTVIGKKYIIEFDVTNNTDGRYLCGVHSSSTWNGTSVTNILYADEITSTTGSTRKSYEFVATSTTSMLMVGQIGTVTCYFDNIAVFPADAISRSDLVFLESWHEDISEKNFVYPLGNVQYLGGNTDGLTGIANGAFTGFETYSLFGNWQTPSALIGKGYVWSSLTEAQKRAFISNSENNCYLDGDKTIQVRYRVRVVQGLGDINDNPFSWVGGYLGTIPFNIAAQLFVAKGKKVSIPTEYKTYANRLSEGVYSLNPINSLQDVGIRPDIACVIQGYSETNVAYEGKCYALPIALVHRRNQGGIYHPTYNPNGSKKLSDGNFWYNTTIPINSTMDCFDSSKMLTASGNIGTTSGRPDGLFYDQVHEGDITDLRNNSKKVDDYNRLISREFNKLVAGTTRGKEGEWQLSVKTQSQLGGHVGSITIVNGTTRVYRNSLTAFGLSLAEVDALLNSSRASVIIGNNIYKLTYNNSTECTASSVIDTTLLTSVGTSSGWTTYNGFIYLSGGNYQSTRTKANTLLHCDIIGNPTNYPTYWKESGVFGTPLIVAEDGTSLLPDGVRDTFKLSRKANATPLLCLRSTDSGATWTSFTPTFNTITNEITLTNEPAGNLVMVYYQTKTSMAVPVVNSEVLEIGDVAIMDSNAYRFSCLANTLIGKTTVGIGYAEATRLILDTYNTYTNKLSASAQKPSHQGPNMSNNTSNMAVKVFPYLTRTNGKAFLNLVFKEMKHNGTSWGDDNKFNIVDNVSTTTDNNAQTVLIGQKTVELPYFIAGDE